MIKIWECELTAVKRDDEDVHVFVDALNLVPPLELRDTYGGRTNATCL